MAFKIKKPIWHGTDSHKEEIEKQVKKGAPQMTFTPGAKGYDFGGGENTLLEKDYKSKYPNLYGDPFATDESTDESTDTQSTVNAARESKEKKDVAQDTDDRVKYDADGNIIEGDKWYEKKAFKESGIGSIVEAAKSIGKGIKNIRAKSKAKKAEKLTAAKEAVGSGSESLKQAKLVERNRRKEDRKAKRDIKRTKKEAERKKKDKEKLAKYRKKNPVRGKEAIKLLTGNNKSLV